MCFCFPINDLTKFQSTSFRYIIIYYDSLTFATDNYLNCQENVEYLKDDPNLIQNISITSQFLLRTLRVFSNLSVTQFFLNNLICLYAFQAQLDLSIMMILK